MLRKLASWLHLYLGLAAFAVLIPIGFTGGVLVFHDEIDAALYPELVHVEPEGERVPVDRAVAVVRDAFPRRAIERLELPRGPHEPYEAVLRDGRQVYVDPYRGVLLGARGPRESVTGVLFELHTDLLAGPVGKQVVGVTGLVLVVLSLSGLVLWWRGWRRVRRGLSVQWKASARRANYDLHNALGAFAVLPLAVVAFTGAGLVYFTAFSHAAHGLTGTERPSPPPVSTLVEDGETPSLDVLVQRAQAALPEATAARIDFPAPPRGTYRVRLRHPEELHPVGLSMVYLDRYSGQVLRAESALGVPPARKFGYLFYPLHIGSYGGLAVRVIYALLGLAPVVLAVTGALIWYMRRRRRNTGAAKKARREALPTRPAALPLEH